MKIKFSEVILKKISDEYYDMQLLNINGDVVYKSTLPKMDALSMIIKYKNVKIVEL
jgi:hypothetical protein